MQNPKKKRRMEIIIEEHEVDEVKISKTELDIINKCVSELEFSSDYYINESFLESVKKLLDECKQDEKNRCVGCNIDLGQFNSRQYCCKTYCPDEKFD